MHMAPSTIPNGASQDDASQLPAAVMDNGYRYGSFPRLRQNGHDVEALPSSAAVAVIQPAATDSTKTSVRVLAPDLVRGLLMAIMALDHCAVEIGVWGHGTAGHNEEDSVPVTRWTIPTGYIVRSITHLCMAGFTFLLGMGVVYLARSRTKMGWGADRLVWYFFVRMAVLTAVSVAFGLLASGFQVWFFNIALFSLAVNYFIAGVLWLLVEQSESLLARTVNTLLPVEDDEDDPSTQPLLHSASATQPGKHATVRASSVSWHVHNVALFILSLVTIFWNIWLSPTHGHCTAATSDTSDVAASDSGAANISPDLSTPVSLGEFLRRVWFHNVEGRRVVSVSPPLAWVSFAILGLLYGRIMTRRRWSLRAQTFGHAAIGLFFFLLFVSTRLLRYGNLSEGCLQTPPHEAHPDTNPYLEDAASFFYVVKYPPSVAYYGLTMSVLLFLLAAATEVPAKFATRRLTMLLDFGTAALFFYIVHLIMVAILGTLILSLFGVELEEPNPAPMMPTKRVTQLWLYWLYWFALILIMWPLCKWYSRFKSKKGPDSLWRLF